MYEPMNNEKLARADDSQSSVVSCVTHASCGTASSQNPSQRWKRSDEPGAAAALAESGGPS